MSEPAPDHNTQPAAAKSGLWAEIESLKSPEAKNVAAEPKVGAQAPTAPELSLPDGRKTIVLFLRHCGCPFAEKTFKALTSLSDKQRDVHCIAVSHSSSEATERWIPQVGGVWQTDIIVDENRDLYAKWGLGLSSTWHAFNPMALYSVYRLGADEGIWNRPTESGSRWQKSGAFAVDGDGTIRWRHISKTADDLPDFNAALEALGVIQQD
ncbi:thioredoxin-like fold protein [Pochonia chlamydosporia 170]|uniref:Thioredoxin-like fold protein n=1 Tax=Pochonia chlamydosporia 170 TaxID=1380566 RepID=A0A179FSX9_METCM|nr:thioredoxin-like fold protein [Pochonia chlamydosporia 170]OAQ68241.1 thioredoxin-like fold protein [Pochonia chlamydosporia 170]